MTEPHPLVQEYGPLLPHVDAVPRSASEIYRRWTGCTINNLSRRRRNERKWCAIALRVMSKNGELIREVTIAEDGEDWVGYRRPVDAPDPAGDQPRGPTPSGKDRRPDGRGVGQ